MRPIKQIGLVMMTLSALAIVACGGSSETEMPSIANGLQFPAGTNAILSAHVDTAPGAAALTVETSTGLIDLTTAFVGISEVNLETSEGGSEGEFDLEGPFIVNLVDGTVENCGDSSIDDDADDDGIEDSVDSDDDNDGIDDFEDADDDNDGIADSEDSVPDENEIFDALQLVPGTYEKVELKLDKIEEGDNCTNDILLDRSLFVEGSLDGQDFRIISEFDEEFERESPEGIVVDDSSIASFILSFDLSCWFEGIDLTGADTVDGVVVIDKDTNSALLEDFRDKVKACGDLEGDDDGDGIPNSDE